MNIADIIDDLSTPIWESHPPRRGSPPRGVPAVAASVSMCHPMDIYSICIPTRCIHMHDDDHII